MVRWLGGSEDRDKDWNKRKNQEGREMNELIADKGEGIGAPGVAANLGTMERKGTPLVLAVPEDNREEEAEAKAKAEVGFFSCEPESLLWGEEEENQQARPEEKHGVFTKRAEANGNAQKTP